MNSRLDLPLTQAMPKFVSGSSGDPYAHDKSRVQEEDEILSVISRETTQDSAPRKPSAVNKKSAKEKQKSSLDLFKEELRRLNEERDEQRNKLKNSLDGSSTQPDSSNNSSQVKPQQPVPVPLKPDPRCPTALTLKVNLSQRDKDAPSLGSFDTGDPTTTNLYVGNLNPIVTENDLCDIFGKFGPLASIKIMWPRTDEERARNRNSGFVAYMSRVDADRALKTLAGMEFKNYEMKLFISDARTRKRLSDIMQYCLDVSELVQRWDLAKYNDIIKRTNPQPQLGWGKAVPLPKDPVFIPNELQTLLKPPPPSGMPFNAQLHEIDIERQYRVPDPLPKPQIGSETQTETYREFLEVLERSTVHVHEPQDRQVMAKIHKTIEYCLREGPVFEAIIIAREAQNPQYRFLYDHKSPEHVYYRWKLYSLLHGEDPYIWRSEPFKMFAGGPWWRPPSLNPFADGMPIELVEKLTGINREILLSGRSASDLSRKLEIVSERGSVAGNSELKFRGKFDDLKVKFLNEVLAKLMPTKESVGAAMLFCINHSDAAEEVIKNVEQALANHETASPTAKIAQLFLISDILHNSSAAVTNASFYRKGFQVRLASVFENLREFMHKIEDSVKAEKFKKRALSVLSSWNHFHIYESNFLVELSDILLGTTRTQKSQSQDRESPPLSSGEDQQPVLQSSDVNNTDGQLDGEAIDDATLAKCLEDRGLSLRWYKTLELSDDELDDADEPQATSSRPPGSPLTPRSGTDKPDERVRFKASKWELVNQEEEEPTKTSPNRRLKPIRTITASELIQQQMQKQSEVVSSADEYESLGSSDESNK